MSVIKQIRPFHTVLVANRGEIALRILRTLRRMGYASVAVFSEADRDGPHVLAADRAVCIGAAAPAQSYLNMAALIDAARSAGADAVHPGYGFLSENADFADAVDAAGLVFIGPSGDAIRAMGNKAGAKRLMLQSGMPCIPGYQGEDQRDETLTQQAFEIGYPVMCKAAAGGGGRGMRLVTRPQDLPAALASARSEARTAFGSEELILERAVLAPRHVEIQLLADAHGQVLHLGERDCSVQRRHQKVIEEAPSPAVDADLRQRMGQAAVQSAQALGYIGAGTMEFLLDPQGNFYFMEMNTRLQVEHAVTEAITGLDLVEWQLRVAAGEHLPWTQEQITLQGHAIEVRLTAEDVPAGFLPQVGPVLRWRAPQGRDVRVDSALVTGGEVSAHYDSMVAKLVAHGSTREEARRKLLRAVQDCVLLGVSSNQGFLADCLSDDVFVQGQGVHTGFVAERMGTPAPVAPQAPWRTWVMAALASELPRLAAGGDGRVRPAVMAPGQAHGVLVGHGQRCRYALEPQGGHWQVQLQLDDAPWQMLTVTDLRWCDDERTEWAVSCAGVTERVLHAQAADQLHVFHAGRTWLFDRVSPHVRPSASKAGGDVHAPLTARVQQVLVVDGQNVQAGERLLVLEAMKMEHVLTSPVTGVVCDVGVQSGGQALKGALLLRIEAVQEVSA